MIILNRLLQFILNYLLLPLGIIAFNLYLLYPWFLGSGPANLGSIEVSYVSMAKLLIDNWPHLSWVPIWYLGFPFHLIYVPVLPTLIAFSHALSNLTIWQTYRIWTGIGLVLTPVSLFFLVLSLTKNNRAALSSGILYSIMPSVFNFILPSGEVRADSFSHEFYDPRRLVNLARWGEGPHIFSLIFLPLGALFFFKALKDGKASSILLAAFFSGLTALTNAIGLYALVLLLVWAFIVKMFFDPKKRGESFIAAVLVAAVFSGLIAFWYNWTFMSTFFSEGGGTLQNWINMFPWGVIFLVIITFLVLGALKKFIRNEILSSIFLWTLSLFTIVAVYYSSAPPNFWQERIELAPQALRYILEADMGMAASVGCFVAFLAKRISAKNKLAGNMFEFILLVAILAASLGYGFLYAPTAWKALGVNVDLEKTAERKMADFFATKVDSQKGERVFSAGNYAFYLNYFTNIWQLRGGLYQAKTHPWPEHIYYQLRTGKDPQITQAWLEIANTKYIAVIPGPEYEVKDKFQNLPLVATLGDGSLIYEVPLSNTSPVKIVNLSHMRNLRAPVKGDDKEAILAYASWLEEIPQQSAGFQRINNNFYKIKAKVNSGEGILVQMTADNGWKAASPKGGIEIKKDPLGFLVLIPDKEGDYEITLSHGKTGDMWLGYLVTLMTLAASFIILRRKSGIVLDK